MLDRGALKKKKKKNNLLELLLWELNYKESWVLKNWCFWTVVLEKTPEGLLGLQENQTSQS